MESTLRFRLTQDFLDECKRYDLRFSCEFCVYFDIVSQQCAHGYPNDEHRLEVLSQKGVDLVFCKEFEII
jgi:hypothetical protein